MNWETRRNERKKEGGNKKGRRKKEGAEKKAPIKKGAEKKKELSTHHPYISGTPSSMHF
jgi:hypothetical protein